MAAVAFIWLLTDYFSLRDERKEDHHECSTKEIAAVNTVTAEKEAAAVNTVTTEEETSEVNTITNEAAIEAVRKFGKLLAGLDSKDIKLPECTALKAGVGEGHHKLCGPLISPERKGCHFVSFGIADDYTFDTFLGDSGCIGIGLDPSVLHPAKLHPNVMFITVGANSLEDTPPEWQMTSVPALLKFLKWEFIDVLKMDCEGCEYAIARDVLAEDPGMFQRVDQFAIEVHVGKMWLTSVQHLVNFGSLLILLEEAGLELFDARIGHCNKVHEDYGCLKELLDIGYPCDRQCQNFLFARSDKF